MNCYTVAENSRVGFVITNALDEEPSLIVGENEHIQIGRHAAIRARVEYIDKASELLSRAERTELKDEASKRLEVLLKRQLKVDANIYEKVEKAEGLYNKEPHMRYAEIWAKASRNEIILINAEVGTGDPYGPIRLLEEEHLNSSECLVHVTTQAVPGGTLWYEGSIWKRQTKDGKTEHVYGSFPSMGVRVVAKGDGPNGETHILAILEKGASFHICRDGDLSSDSYGTNVSNILAVAWDGVTLTCSPPQRPQRSAA